MERIRRWAITAAVAAVVLLYGYGFAGERSILTLHDVGRYEGEVRHRHEEPHGQGVKTWPDGERHEGEFRDGWIIRGAIAFPGGERHEGEFRDGVLIQGVATFPDGTRGEVREGEFHRP